MISFVLKKKEILEDKSESNTCVTIKVLLENDLMSKDNVSIFFQKQCFLANHFIKWIDFFVRIMTSQVYKTKKLCRVQKVVKNIKMPLQN